MKHYSFQAPEELMELLDRLAKTKFTSRSQLIRRAIALLLKEESR